MTAVVDAAPAPPPPPAALPIEVGPSQRRARLALAVAVMTGLLIDLWLRTPADGLAGTAAFAVVAVGLVSAGGVRSASGRALLGASVVVGAFLALRAAPWLVAVDVAAGVVLLAIGATLGSHRSVLDVGFAELARGAGRLVPATFATPAGGRRAARAAAPAASPLQRRRVAALGRGMALAAPVALAVGLLLAEGDAVFAAMFDLSFDLGSATAHVVVTLLGTWVAGAFLLAARNDRAPARSRAPLRIGTVEGCVVLAGLVAVYALFAVARLLVALRGDDYVAATTGLTYAEYARTGFFQLLWAAGITLVVLLVLRAGVSTPTKGARRAVAGLSLVAVTLTLVLVHAALVRLELYQDAFGATVLRLSSSVFAGWVGIAFVLTGLALAGVGRSHRWLAGAIVWSAIATLVAFNAADPERIVVATNVERAAVTGELDVTHALELSSDAVPTLVAALPSLPADQRDDVATELCRRHALADPPGANLSKRRAAAALDGLCG